MRGIRSNYLEVDDFEYKTTSKFGKRWKLCNSGQVDDFEYEKVRTDMKTLQLWTESDLSGWKGFFEFKPDAQVPKYVDGPKSCVIVMVHEAASN